MTMKFYLVRDQLKKLYGNHAVLIMCAVRFVVALICLILMNVSMGYQKQLGSLPVVLVLSVICALLPWNGLILVLTVCLLINFMAVSVEVAAIAAALFFIMWILNMIVQPECAVVVVLIPMLFFFKIPYVVPILVALWGSLAGIVPVICGVMVYYIIRAVSDSASVLSNAASLNVLQRIMQVLDSFRNNKVMYIMIVAFVVVYLLVFLMKKMSFDYVRIIGIIIGTVVNALVLLVGELVLQIDTRSLPILWVVLGSLLSGMIAVIADFFFFAVDYRRTEYVQFEDDDYYYYVKAVPKIVVTAPDRQVKKITTRTEKHSQSETASPGQAPTEKSDDEFWG